jgi:tetratricopeptide (TPR) repeat protein
MKTLNKKHILDCLMTLVVYQLLAVSANAQVATVREVKETFPTYPYSDPNPVARMSNIYPYFRFDGYSVTSVPKEWKLVSMENPYIKLLVAPDMGGKILGAFEKSTGKPFVYFNKVIKFREIAMRGPWTSGGIEFNFGDIGHTPTTAAPVDYLTRTNEDGSVSCVIGTKDLASRTEWRVEIRLPKDKAYFETNAFWYNPTDVNTSLYHWVCGSGDVDQDLHFEYPGTAYIGHGGDAYPYPIDKQGRDISYYANNAFGSNKSFHVLGYYTDYFGARWTNEDFGAIHWSRYTDKLGKKIWQWAHSREGEIWTDLLTDPQRGNKQYMEIQSGLLFNQAASSSGLTPFKHLFFAPGSEERFTEAWFPFWKIGGVVDANLHGAMSVQKNGKVLKVGVCPVEMINDQLSVTVAGKTAYSKRLSLTPLQTYSDSVVLKQDGDFEVVFGNKLLSYGSKDAEARKLARPAQINPEFDWNSVAGLATDAEEHAKQRDYSGALGKYTECLKKDPAYSPALVGAADCYYRRMEYEKCLSFSEKALANDTYDPDANFVYGLASRKLGRQYDARDAFGLAARSVKCRSAANVQLAELAFLNQDWSKAAMYAKRALDYDRYSVRANRVLAISYRKAARKQEAAKVLSTMLELDPLCHFARFEKFLASRDKNDLDAFTGQIRDELPHETYLELAAYYHGLGLSEDAITLLEKSPRHPMVLYWLAFLNAQKEDLQKARQYLDEALKSSPKLVFPFRAEDIGILQWAEKQSPHWKNKYYLGLVYWSKDRLDVAKKYFADCANTPDFAPFYIVRGNLALGENPSLAEKDYLSAAALDKEEWRAIRILADVYNRQGAYDRALAYLKPAFTKFKNNYIIQFDYARVLLLNRRYTESVAELDKITILPYEGAGYGRETFHQACVLSALECIKKKDWKNALGYTAKARQWPENLGVGKPYEVDERLEDYLEAVCCDKSGESQRAKELFGRAAKPAGGGAYALLSALALRSLGRADEANTLVGSQFGKDKSGQGSRWCMAVFNRNNDQRRGLEREFDAARIKGQWNPVPSDPNFLLVYETMQAIEP